MIDGQSSGYVQQSPWLSVANRQMELMGRYMAEIRLTPAARSRIVVQGIASEPEPVTIVRRIIIAPADEEDGMLGEDGRSAAEDAKGVITLSPLVAKL